MEFDGFFVNKNKKKMEIMKKEEENKKKNDDFGCIVCLFIGKGKMKDFYSEKKIEKIYDKEEIYFIDFKNEKEQGGKVGENCKSLFMKNFNGELSYDELMKVIIKFERVYISSIKHPYDWWRKNENNVGESLFLGWKFLNNFVNLMIEFDLNEKLKIHEIKKKEK